MVNEQYTIDFHNILSKSIDRFHEVILHSTSKYHVYIPTIFNARRFCQSSIFAQQF